MRSTFTILWLIALALVCSKAIAAPSVSESEAKTLIEEYFRNTSIPVLLGAFTVIPNNSVSKGTPGTISEYVYESLIAWEKLGVVSVTKDQELEDFNRGKTSSIERFDEMLKYKGTISKIVVKPTDAGTRLVDRENPKRIKIPIGNCVVTNVVKNEERKKGVDDYRLFMVAFDAQWNPLLKQYGQVKGISYAQKRKGIFLFKWDPFSNKWKIVANDVANADEEFHSNRTADALR